MWKEKRHSERERRSRIARRNFNNPNYKKPERRINRDRRTEEDRRKSVESEGSSLHI